MQISAYTFHNKIMVGDMIQTGYQNGSDRLPLPLPGPGACNDIVFLIQEKIFHGFLILPKQHVSVKAAPPSVFTVLYFLRSQFSL